MAETQQRLFARRVAGQGAMLFSGFAASQAFSFSRNAIIAHWLSKGDFGIAAAILLLLQMLETLSDLGADRLIVQARDGDDPRLVATAHTTLIIRGLLTASILAGLSGPIAGFFRIPEAQWAFAAAALVPLIKGFVHLDSRIAQRHLDNRPQIFIEALPQGFALLLTLPALKASGSYTAVLWLAIAQALMVVVTSHMFAKNRYRIAMDWPHLKRLLAFGLPIWASAFPLIAVYQGDRMLIGRIVGLEGLASYTAAFMMAMVPGLIAAKVANAMMLPLLAAERDQPRRFESRYRLMAEGTALTAGLYLAGFLVAGGTVLPLAFGQQYSGLGTLVGLLALMWSMRMLQAVPGAALLALGMTAPFFTAGLVRASGLILAYIALRNGYGLEGAAAAGALAEFASLAYITARLDRIGTRELSHATQFGTILAKRGAILLPAGAIGVLSQWAFTEPPALLETTGLTVAACLAVTVIAAVVMRDAARQLLALRSGTLP